MAEITLGGNVVHTVGDLPASGTTAPEFTLIGENLKPKSLTDYVGRTVVLNIVPSVDTGICAMSARRFNEEAAGLDGVAIVTISADLPFALKRFCAAEGIEAVEMLSTFRSPQFGKDYGTLIVDGPMEGLQGRAILVLNADHEIVHTELVPEIAQEPDYEAVLAAIESI